MALLQASQSTSCVTLDDTHLQHPPNMKVSATVQSRRGIILNKEEVQHYRCFCMTASFVVGIGNRNTATEHVHQDSEQPGLVPMPCPSMAQIAIEVFSPSRSDLKPVNIKTSVSLRRSAIHSFLSPSLSFLPLLVPCVLHTIVTSSNPDSQTLLDFRVS